MTAKEYILAATDAQGKTLFTRARLVPADKLDWRPLDHGRSVFDIAQECALCPAWCVDVLKNQAYIPSDDEAAYEQQKAALTDLDACEAAFAENAAALKTVIEEFPEADMHKSIVTPWGTFTCYQLMAVALWNCSYHEGQINYIQTLYGDRSM